jgi:signal transduction histidine kinase/CheY-like chemotaxis protein
VSDAEIVHVDLDHDEGVVVARQRTRDVAEVLGFDRLDGTRIATAVSELARNAHRYGRNGRVRLLLRPGSLAIEVIDQGPGIANLDDILDGRYLSDSGMGQGLIGVRQLMDEFSIEAPPGRGTRVFISKRLPGTLDPDPRAIREELRRRGATTPYDEVTRQNAELLQALGEVRSRQQELVALNRELEDTNRGVVALYAELDDRAAQLRDADERKTRFLADMSHELRTPLNSIVALTELLLDGATLEDEQATQVSFIRRTAEQQLRLVGDLLDIAKIEAGKLDLTFGPVSVAELFSLLRAQLRPLVSSDEVRLRFDVAPSVPVLHTDEDKLVQVLRNLVGNALKFTRAGEVAVTAEPADDAVAFRISDTGVGIAAGDLERIFDEFAQVPGEHQRAHEGTGLGLPLSRKLVEALGGRIDVVSEPGVGTTFNVLLPVRGDEGALSSAPVAADLTGAVLVVDDDETSRYIVAAHLRGDARPVHAVAGGEAALEVMAHSVPAALILDLSMPDLDGVEVLQRLRDDPRTAALPVVVHTSRLLSPGERAHLERLGARILDKSTTSRTALLEALSASTEGPARV